MADLFDYLTWRGDLSFDRVPLCAVDGMILARFAYVPFEHFSRPLSGRFVSLRELADLAAADETLRAQQRWRLRDEKLLAALAGTERFGPLPVGFAGSVLDDERQTQFSAVTVGLDRGRYAMVFRGTDNTVVGWKEDMNMSYLCPVPGQKMAVEYVRRVAEKVDGRLVLCGHSKGGNLAVYAGAFCGGDVQERVDAVYNYDGPGFYDNVLDTEDYRRISGRIHTFVPQFSVVGMLLGRHEDCAVVHSTESGLSQHDLYSWEVLGPRFVSVDGVTGGSRFVDSTIKDWTADMTPAQWEVFVDAVYTVLASPADPARDAGELVLHGGEFRPVRGGHGRADPRRGRGGPEDPGPQCRT